MNPKGETLGDRIKRIRGSVHQAAFGKKLGGVSQSTVSAWEKDDKRRLPSADIYFRLAILAPDPKDQIFFLRKAGLPGDVIVSAANKLLREQTARPKAGESFSIPRVEKTAHGLKEAGAPIVMPMELITNPASTYCFGIRLTPAKFCQWVIVDTADSEAENLGPFWGYSVLAEFAPKDEFGPLWPEGLEIGTLFLEEGEPTPEGTPWFARFLQPYVSRVLIGASLRIGMWTERGAKGTLAPLSYPQIQPKYLLGNESPGAVAEHAARLGLQWEATRGQTAERTSRAGREIRLAPGCEIVGRVVAWWFATQESGKPDVRPSELGSQE